jgi:putative transcriptional regulator
MKIKSVSNQIKSFRALNGNLSQAQLAAKVGCTRQTIISLEQNKYSPSFLLVSKLAKVFNVVASDIITLELEDEE